MINRFIIIECKYANVDLFSRVYFILNGNQPCALEMCTCVNNLHLHFDVRGAEMALPECYYFACMR